MLCVFGVDHWREIIDTMQSNRLRTVLTACGVSWGTFMLVVMLGSGNGLRSGAVDNMAGFATNAVYVWGGRTAMPYDGFQPGRFVRFKNADTAAIRTSVSGIEYLCPRAQLGGRGDRANVVHGNNSGSYLVVGDVPDFLNVQPVEITEGRFLNAIDMVTRRKVAVIGQTVHTELFDQDEAVVGDYIAIRGSYFLVVGRFRSLQNGNAGDRQSSSVVVPLSSFQTTSNQPDRVAYFALTAQPWSSAAKVEKEVQITLRRRHHIAPDDPNGLRSFNVAQQFGKMNALFRGIEFLVWFVGAMTLLAGIIGVSNIMLIAVRERIKEKGTVSLFRPSHRAW